MGTEIDSGSSPLIHPVERIRDYLRTLRLLLGQTRDQVHVTRVELAQHLAGLEQLASQQLAQLEKLAAAAPREGQQAQLVEILRLIHDQGPRRRAQLRELRGGDEYERAYADPDPLVSVVIPTYDNHELLAARAIPSVLAQTYQNFEIVVVGDAAPDQARLAAESFDDPRITYFDRLFRGPYSDDPEVRWLVAGVPPYNEAVRRARGLWIAPLDDDDAFRPHHIEQLLERAREQRLELCYGRICVQLTGGGQTTIGRFPPEHGHFNLQAAIYHAGLAKVFELELADAAFGLPYDWGICQRMMEADVRIGMVEEVAVDYYPSRGWASPLEESLPASDDVLPEWEFVPEGFARARVVGEQAAVGWRAEEVASAYREKWPRFVEAVEGDGALAVNHEVPAGAPIERNDVLAQNAVLAYAYALGRSQGSGPISVLDYGGALGHHYVLARRLFPELEFDYHCRELPAVCATGREVLPEVTFHDTDVCFDRDYDLVVASSSLQYEEDWRMLLRRLAGASRRWTFLTRVPIARDHASFVVLQRAHAYGYATEYLGWVLSRDELLGAASDSGLALERELLLLPELSIHGAPEAFAHAGFLFRAGRAG